MSAVYSSVHCSKSMICTPTLKMLLLYGLIKAFSLLKVKHVVSEVAD